MDRPVVLIAASRFSTPWLQAYKSLMREFSGFEIRLIDLSKFAGPEGFSLSRPFWKLLLSRSFRNQLEDRILKPKKSHNRKVRENFTLSTELASAINSELHTVFKSSDTGAPIMRVHRRLREYRLRRAHEFLLNLNIDMNIDLLVIPNGRFPLSVLTKELLSRQSKETRFLEVAYGRYTLETFAIHDRVGLAAFLRGQRRDTLSYEPKIWLNNQAQNVFAAQFEAASRPEAFPMAFFTSSSDEHWALPGSWQEHEWVDQFDSFDAVLSQCMPQTAVMRVHPNLKWKSLRHFWRETKLIADLSKKHSQLKVFGPFSKINSYELAARASLNVVSISTIGLEIILRGGSVVSTFPNLWNAYVDSPIWSGRETIQCEDVNHDQESATHLAAFLTNRGQDRDTEIFSSKLGGEICRKLDKVPLSPLAAAMGAARYLEQRGTLWLKRWLWAQKFPLETGEF